MQTKNNRTQNWLTLCAPLTSSSSQRACTFTQIQQSPKLSLFLATLLAPRIFRNPQRTLCPFSKSNPTPTSQTKQPSGASWIEVPLLPETIHQLSPTARTLLEYIFFMQVLTCSWVILMIGSKPTGAFAEPSLPMHQRSHFLQFQLNTFEDPQKLNLPMHGKLPHNQNLNIEKFSVIHVITPSELAEGRCTARTLWCNVVGLRNCQGPWCDPGKLAHTL